MDPIISIVIFIFLILVILLFSKTYNTNKSKIIWFFRPGCGHCDNMTSEWSKFVAGKPPIETEKINTQLNPAMAAEYGVMGVPHIVKETDGVRVVYTGDRTSEDFLKFTSS